MAKEFDIYLNKRLTECDIIVYSIPFRDGYRDEPYDFGELP